MLIQRIAADWLLIVAVFACCGHDAWAQGNAEQWALGDAEQWAQGNAEQSKSLDTITLHDYNERWAALQREAGKEIGGLRCEATLSAKECSPGGEITLKVSVKNTTARTIQFLLNEPMVPVLLVRDENGHRVRRIQNDSDRSEEAQLVLFVSNEGYINIDAGKTITTTFPVSRYYDLRKQGEYEILAIITRATIRSVTKQPAQHQPVEMPAVEKYLLSYHLIVGRPLHLRVRVPDENCTCATSGGKQSIEQRRRN